MIIKCASCGGENVEKVSKNHLFGYREGEKVYELKAYMPVYCCPDCDFEYYGPEGEQAIVDAVFKFQNR